MLTQGREEPQSIQAGVPTDEDQSTLPAFGVLFGDGDYSAKCPLKEHWGVHCARQFLRAASCQGGDARHPVKRHLPNVV